MWDGPVRLQVLLGRWHRALIALVAGLAAIGVAASGGPTAAAASGMDGLPPAHEAALFASTYRSLADRVTARGYAPTSLTGYYGAMYTRDSSVNALALLLGGDDAGARAILRYIFRYGAASGAERMPHRIYQESDTLADAGQQTDVSSPSAGLGAAATAAEQMPAPGLVTAVDVWLDATSQARGTVRATLLAGTGPNAQVVDTTSVPVDQIPAGGGWVTMRFLPPLFSNPPAGYVLRLDAPDTPPGSVTWRGAADGTLSYRERTTDFRISGYDMYDETDQAYSVLLVWARYVRANPDDRAFVNETWPYVRRYANYYLDTPGYLNASLDLIRNPILDDEGYHNTYDLLTNVFASQALHELGPLAARLADPADATRWEAVSAQLEHGIDTNLVTTVDGQRIYGEKYEVSQGDRFYPGYSFANLAPIAVDWYALDRQIMTNTLAAYAAHESRDWSGVQMLSSMHDYGFTGHNDWVLTKGLAWEWRFEQQVGDQARISALDAFLQHYYPDTSQPISEGWILDSDGNLRITDPGNQEHASWYAVEMLDSYPGLQGAAHAINASLSDSPASLSRCHDRGSGHLERRSAATARKGRRAGRTLMRQRRGSGRALTVWTALILAATGLSIAAPAQARPARAAAARAAHRRPPAPALVHSRLRTRHQRRHRRGHAPAPQRPHGGRQQQDHSVECSFVAVHRIRVTWESSQVRPAFGRQCLPRSDFT